MLARGNKASEQALAAGNTRPRGGSAGLASGALCSRDAAGRARAATAPLAGDLGKSARDAEEAREANRADQYACSAQYQGGGPGCNARLDTELE